MDSDWFIIGLEVVFILLISYDVKKYLKTKKREYIVNIVLTVGFAIWTLYPFYTSYFEWDEKQKEDLIVHCSDVNDSTLCTCIDKAVFKTFTHEEYVSIDKDTSEFGEFLKETKEDCNDSGWF